MRVIAGVVTMLGAVLAVGCGSYDPVVPPSSELVLVTSFDPDPAGGMRPSTTVMASLVLQPQPEGAVVGIPIEKAEFTVWDAAGRALAQASGLGPLPFDADGRVTFFQVLDWEPADALGHAMTVRFTLGRTAPEQRPTVIEKIITF